ncbi:MAG: hypothetical protein HY000_01045 [Planctomycetes bacterium]|nr:hypothetical protein [Planctomycetota bacterium]
MNNIHQAFASEPALPLTLDKLFEVLDCLDPQERYEYLSPVFLVVLKRVGHQTSARDYETAYKELYQEFKSKCLTVLQSVVHQQFLAYSIVAQALAWLHIFADERHMQEAIDFQGEQIRQSEADLKAGIISRSQHEQLVRECEERFYNLPSDRRLMQDRYNAFCEKVVKRFLYYPPVTGEE